MPCARGSSSLSGHRTGFLKRAGGVVVEPGQEVFLDVLFVGQADSPVKVALKPAGLGRLAARLNLAVSLLDLAYQIVRAGPFAQVEFGIVMMPSRIVH